MSGSKMGESNIHLGTSGWSYNEWEGPFYQKGEKRKLRAYMFLKMLKSIPRFILIPQRERLWVG